MSPILDIQRRMVELGRIRYGAKGPKGAPRKLDMFRLTSASRTLLEAAASVYGGQAQAWEGAPDEGYFELFTDADTLDILLPPVFSDSDGQPTLPYSQWLELWSGGGCVRRCDGATEMLSGKSCVCDAGDDGPDARVCKPTTRLNVMLPRIPGLGVWRLESHGWHAASILPGTLEVLLLAASKQQFIPGVLRLEQRSAKKAGQTLRFVVPVVDVPGLRFDQVLSGLAPVVNAPAVSAPRPALPAGPEPPAEPAFAHDEPVVVELPPGPDLPPPGQEEYVASLTGSMTSLLEELGAQGTIPAIAKHRDGHSLDEHTTWLEHQIGRAQEKLRERSEKPEEFSFAAKARQAQQRRASKEKTS